MVQIRRIHAAQSDRSEIPPAGAGGSFISNLEVPNATSSKNPTGFHRWIVQFQPSTNAPDIGNPTSGRECVETTPGLRSEGRCEFSPGL